MATALGETSRYLATLRKFISGSVVGVALALAIAETALRCLPGLLSGGLADQVYSNYRVGPGGIYYVVPDYPLRFCRPNFTTQMYANGYSWNHETDQRGYRNPPGTRSDLLLLGDSQIYGHGVEEPETLGAVLRNRFGWGAYNMGRQGDCLYDSYVVTRLDIDQLKPKTVVLFIFFNDFKDVVYYKGETMPQPELEWDYETLRRLRDAAPAEYPLSAQLDRLKIVRLFKGLGKAASEPSGPQRSSSPDPTTAAIEFIMPVARFHLAMSYYGDMLPRLAQVCDEAGSRLHVVYLSCGLPGVSGFDQHAAGLVGEVCADHEIPFANTDGLVTEALVLPGDGHLTPRGHAALAEWLDGFLRQADQAANQRPALSNGSP